MRQRILFHHHHGKSYHGIVKILAIEGHSVTKAGICKFLRRFRETGCVERKAGMGKASKKTPDLLRKVDEQMESNDETSLEELRVVMQNVHGIKVSVSTLHRWHEELRWSAKGTKYCQMIREANVGKP